ncbi:MAG: hypothetical protein RDU01_04790 [Thermodesulfovibrionales bacterium]|nr:hypothetical protein [Thermodesulfovibrionales bacterium]
MKSKSDYWSNYIALPSQTPPKYLLSLENKRIFLAGLNFYPALTFRSKVKKAFLSHSYNLLKKTQYLINRNVNDENMISVPEFINEIGMANKKFNLYVPSYQKIIIQVLNNNGECEGIIKLALDDFGKKSIGKEIINLNKIANIEFKNLEIPKIMKSAEKSRMYYFVMNCPSQYRPFDVKKRNSSILEILIELFRVTRSEEERLNETKIYLNIKSKIFKIQDQNIRDLCIRTINLYDTMNDVRIPLCLVHYDFKPWNLITNCTTNAVLLVDWELMEENGLPLWDAYAYILFTFFTLKYDVSPLNAFRYFRQNENFFIEYTDKVCIDRSLIEKLLPLYLLDMITIGDLWARWENTEERPNKVWASMIKLLEYLIEKNLKGFNA